ncbi:hypothetical protein KFZ76_20000 [Methylovulum psychrotolerans]|uniref:hypothetical protein n=1 Tax=Methylovulum psychrotolerans TaxID=1704499 RepID=UPI001BFFC7CB|nr:hypothetical protein [Methylovulum psychrotolerans]MBT9099987.1 hypothetical protein [Methylovulum psychrotolerans]
MLTPDLVSLQLMLNQAGLINAALLTDELLTQTFNAAYAQAQRELRVFFTPTEIIPDDAPPEEVAALVAAKRPYAQEAFYYYDPAQFGAAPFGFLATRMKPIIAVHRIELAYPGSGQVFTVPQAWLNLDRKYGQIQLIPTALSVDMPFSATLPQVLGGGFSAMPLLVRLRYLAGLTDVETCWPDIVALVNRMTVLNVLKLAFLPGSQSLSADGFSRSTSLNLAAWQGAVDELKHSLLDSIHGVRMG